MFPGLARQLPGIGAFTIAGLCAPVFVWAIQFAASIAAGVPLSREALTSVVYYLWFGSWLALPAALLLGYPWYRLLERWGHASLASTMASAGVLGAGLLGVASGTGLDAYLVGGVAGLCTGLLLWRLLFKSRARSPT